MVADKFWDVVKKYNVLMSSAIEGPNCLDICHGDCCSIKIDIPKILAKEFIKKGFAKKSDFIRSDVFSFKLRFDEKKAKCFLFDNNINGCLIHNSGIKPPQCWIYPTNFSNPDNNEIRCKRANGWKIIDSDKLKAAEELLQYYIFLCKLEAKREIRNIKNRLSSSISENTLKNSLINTPPHEISGFSDTWDCISILPAEGFSLQLKKYCQRANKQCDFLKCSSVCDKVSTDLINFLQQNLYDYIKSPDYGSDGDGEYPIIKLKKIEEEK
ncbi:MAG: YkgJ family cysteine cluster protein [Promethearchaeota archaeon]